MLLEQTLVQICLNKKVDMMSLKTQDGFDLQFVVCGYNFVDILLLGL